MSLSDRQIIAEREAGRIIIEPFDRRCLGSDTYDVRLGEFFYREKWPISSEKIYDLSSMSSVGDVWELHQAPEVGSREQVLRWPSGSRVIWLDPGETILAHTVEFIGARSGFTTKMYSRSSIGRSMLGVCKCAGRGDVGYFNRWTMEITSFSRFHQIPLRVGMRVAQIEFIPVASTDRTYGVTHGKYQESGELEMVMRDWKPEAMLPRLDRDWELK